MSQEDNTLGHPRDDLFGITHDFVTKLRNGTITANAAKLFLRKENPWPAQTATIVQPSPQHGKLIIDLDAAPNIPNDWKVEEHRPGGLWKFSAKKVKLYLADNQRQMSVRGDILQWAFKERVALNANVIDWLCKEENQNLIPKSWEGKCIFFWGTIYRDLDRNLLVRCLWKKDYIWGWGWRKLTDYWRADSPAALLAS